jgi:hypothetical protein
MKTLLDRKATEVSTAIAFERGYTYTAVRNMQNSLYILMLYVKGLFRRILFIVGDHQRTSSGVRMR